MKKILLIFGILTISIYSYSQDYMQTGTTWHFNKLDPFSNDTTYYKIVVGNDTLINGYACKYLNYEANYGSDQCSVWLQSYYVMSQDSIVYFYNSTFNELQPLYNFGGNTGSSWYFRPTGGSCWIDSIGIYVDSISTQNINGIDLKVQNVSYNSYSSGQPSLLYNSQIIERIGDINTLFNVYLMNVCGNHCEDYYQKGLRCFEDSIIGLYSTMMYENCTYLSIVNVSNIPTEETIISIYPNPSKDEIFINSTVLENLIFEIYNSIGVLIKSGMVDNKRISVGNFQNGLYVIRLFSKGILVETKKLTVVNTLYSK